MPAVEKKKKYTDKDYSLLEEGAPFQLIDNDLVMSSAPSIIHQRLFFKISSIIAFFYAAKPQGEWFYAPIDVKLDDGNVYQPDFLYVTQDRIADIVKDRIEGAPDLVIEILSPFNANYDIRQKKNIYEKFGVAEYIVIDSIQQNAELYGLEHGLFVLKQRADKLGHLTQSCCLASFSTCQKYLRNRV